MVGNGANKPGYDSRSGILKIESMRKLLSGGVEGNPLLVCLQHQCIPFLRVAPHSLNGKPYMTRLVSKS